VGQFNRSLAGTQAVSEGMTARLGEPLRKSREVSQARVQPSDRQRQLAAVSHGQYVKAPAGLRLRNRKIRRLAARVRAQLPWLEVGS
jgi:hypothetical protein